MVIPAQLTLIITAYLNSGQTRMTGMTNVSTPIIRVSSDDPSPNRVSTDIGWNPNLVSRGRFLELFGPMENLNSTQSNNQVSADSPMTTVEIPQMTTNNF